MPSLNIHRNDTVKVLTGSDRGKTGRVLRVFPDKGTVLVEHVRVVKKTVSSKTGPADQGRYCRAGVADQRVERDAGLPQLRTGARGPQDRGRIACARVQEVRADAAHKEVVRTTTLEIGRREARCMDGKSPSATVNGRRQRRPIRGTEEREQKHGSTIEREVSQGDQAGSARRSWVLRTRWRCRP